MPAPLGDVDVVTGYPEGTDTPGGHGSPWHESREALRAWFDQFWEPEGDY